MTGKQLRHILFVWLVLVGWLCALCLPSLSQTAPLRLRQAVTPNRTSQAALKLAQTGEQQYRNQQFSDAALSWQQAAEAYQAVGDQEGVQKSLINHSQALQDLGLYPRACRALLQALASPPRNCDAETITQLVAELSDSEGTPSMTESVGLRSLGDVLRRQGLLPQSKQVLALSLAIANDSPEVGATLLSLGNTERSIGKQVRNRWDYEEITDIINRQSADIAIQPDRAALQAYQQAVEDAPITTQLQAQLNQLSLWLDLQAWWETQTNQRLESWQRMDQKPLIQRAETFSAQFRNAMAEQTSPLRDSIEAELRQLPPSRTTIFAQLNYAKSLMRLRDVEYSGLSSSGNTFENSIKTWLQASLEQSQSLKDQRAEAYALGYLGQFYGDLGQLETATQFTQQALMLTNQLRSLQRDAREVSYLWQAQLGYLLDQQGDREGALMAYTNAYESLQSLRSDLTTSNPDVQFDFQQEVKPVYLALADLLLRPESVPNELSGGLEISPAPGNEQNRLEKARQVLESLQLAELDNFFQDPCSEVPDVPVQIDDIDPEAAVIYPMVFRDRLDLILSIPDQPLRQISVPVSKSVVDRTLDELYDLLNNESIDTSAVNIFRTVPLNPQEVETNVQQLLPIFSQIYDWLVRPLEAQLDESSVKTLVFVLNDRLQRVPMAALYDGQAYLVENYRVALAPSLQLINSGVLQQKRPKVLVAGVSKQTRVGDENFPALINVPNELNLIQAVFPNSKRLLNETFTEQSLKRSLNKDYAIVHLATHGIFSSNPDKNFIVTGNEKSISIDELSQLLGGQSANAPKLLVLSACETATGDNRAVLGLAGVAVRSGASSTLATLWPVSDASTTTFMGEFYRALSQPKRQKTEALQTAQQSLLSNLQSNPPFEELKGLPPHPYYWAPYVLVGSWL